MENKETANYLEYDCYDCEIEELGFDLNVFEFNTGLTASRSLVSCGIIEINNINQTLGELKGDFSKFKKLLQLITDKLPGAYYMISIVPAQFKPETFAKLATLFDFNKPLENPNSGNSIVIGITTKEQIEKWNI